MNINNKLATNQTNNIQKNPPLNFNKERFIRVKNSIKHTTTEQYNSQIFDEKFIISGNILEQIEFDRPLEVKHDLSGIKYEKHSGRGNQNKTDNKTKCENKLITFNRVKNSVKRTVRENVYQNHNKPYSTKLLTLTFKDNITDTKQANEYFRVFIKKLNEAIKNDILPSKANLKWLMKNKHYSKKACEIFIRNYRIKYTRILEYQTRGAVHYHLVLYNFPYVHNGDDFIREIWKKGNQVRLEAINNNVNNSIDSSLNYVTKYVTKFIEKYRIELEQAKNNDSRINLVESRYKDIKFVTNSRGLDKAIILRLNRSFKELPIYKELLSYLHKSSKLACEGLTVDITDKNDLLINTVTYYHYHFSRKYLEEILLLYENIRQFTINF